MTTATETPAAPVSAPLASTIENLRQLSADPSIWDTLPSADGAAPYLPWHTVAKILDAGAPGWHCETVGIHETSETVTVTVKLTIGGAGRCASYQQAKTGTRRDGVIFQVSAPLEKAERRALARAAGLFGLGAEAPARGQVRRGGSPPAERRQRQPEARPEPAGDAAPLCPACDVKPLGRRRDGKYFDQCIDCSRKGPAPAAASAPSSGSVARPPRPVDGNADTLSMIERLPADAAAYSDFLRRMQGSGANEADRRYLWEMAQYHGLAFDQAAREFVQATA